MATVKKIPTRLCIGCQEQHPKRELVRIVKSPEGEFSVDITGKKAGRGAYVCRNRECFDKAVKEHRFEKSFKCSIDQTIFAELEKQLFE